MSINIKVGISEFKVSDAPNILTTLGLGSCVGIALYDERRKKGALGHIMLPDSRRFSDNKIGKYADTAIEAMIKEIGGYNKKLIAKIAGGASMFQQQNSRQFPIGQDNIEMVKKVLMQYEVPIIGEDVGGNVGRTMLVDLANFNVSIRFAGENGNRELKEI